MIASLLTLLAQETPEGGEPIEHLTPKAQELIVGAIAFAVLFFFMARWVLPRLNKALEERRRKIQGELEKAEETRKEADQQLVEYRQQLAQAREEGNRIIEEAHRTAEQLRKDLQAKAEQEAQATVARAQEEIRAERDRVVQELKAQVGVMSVQLAEKVVGASLDADRHAKMIDDFIEEVAGAAEGNGNGRSGDGGSGGG